jgi:hypothetical protein
MKSDAWQFLNREAMLVCGLNVGRLFYSERQSTKSSRVIEL